MAPKRKTYSNSAPKNVTPKEKTPEKRLLNNEEVMCPICFSILICPVTMPCTHRICMPCFKDTVEKANTTCPLCRRRLSLWYRKVGKNSLVDETLWKEIQEQFPDLVKLRLEGSDSDVNAEAFKVTPSHNLVPNGEIGKDFEAEMTKARQEELKRQEDVEKASRMVIEKMMEEEEKEKQRILEERQILLEKDEELAKTLAQGTSSTSPVLRTHPKRHPDPKVTKRKPSTKAKRSLSTFFGFPASTSAFKAATPIRLVSEAKVTRNNTRRASADSIGPETCSVFRPISSAPKTPPKAMPDGTRVQPPIVHPMNLTASLNQCETSGSRAMRSTSKSKVQPSCTITKNLEEDISACIPGSQDGLEPAGSTQSSVFLTGNMLLSPAVNVGDESEGSSDESKESKGILDISTPSTSAVGLKLSHSPEYNLDIRQLDSAVVEVSYREDTAPAKKIPKRSSSPGYDVTYECEIGANNNHENGNLNLSEVFGVETDLNDLRKAEKSFEERLEQEKRDMELAKQLQKEFDKLRRQELNQRDSYELRAKSRRAAGQLSLKEMLGKRKR